MSAGGAVTGVPEAPKGGAKGAAPFPEGERNPAEGGCFASIYKPFK